MSTATQPRPPKPAPPAKAKSEGKRLKTEASPIENVVRALGKWHGWNPLPGQGHKWMLAPHVKVSPTCYLMWAWLFDHSLALGSARQTPAFGQRSPYAVIKYRDGDVHTAHLEHLAADLNIEIRNARRYWEEGLEAGIWRAGEGEEGAKQMYLCSEVKKAPVPESSAEPPSRVCTYPWGKLPTYVSNHLQNLDPDRQAAFWQEYSVTETVGKLLVAETVAAGREVIGQEQDTLFSQFGAEKIRQNHKKSGATEEEIRARAERLAKLRETLLGYVHTLREFVQSESATMYKAPYIPENSDASLLRSETLQRQTEARAGAVSVDGHSKRSEAQESNEGEELKSLPAQTRTARDSQKPRNESAEETTGVLWFLNEVAELQKQLQHTSFGSPVVKLENKGDRTWGLTVVRELGRENLAAFLPDLKAQLGLVDKNALGKLPRPRSIPASAPRERFFGMIREWAGDFARDSVERIEKQKAAEEQERKRAVFEAAAEKRKWAAAVEQAKDVLADPRSDEQDRQYAQEVLADPEVNS